MGSDAEVTPKPWSSTQRESPSMDQETSERIVGSSRAPGEVSSRRLSQAARTRGARRISAPCRASIQATIASGTLREAIMPSATSTAKAPSPAQSSPPGKPRLPTITRPMMPIRSVSRSATTMGAVRGPGTPCVSASTRLLNTSPTFPGVTVSTNPDRKVRKLSSFGTPRISSRAR